MVLAIVFRALHRASSEVEAERKAFSARLAAEEEERSIREQERLVRKDVDLSLLRVRDLGQRLLPEELASQVAVLIDEALTKPWNHRDVAANSAEALIRIIADDCRVQVDLRGTNPVLDPRSVGAVQAISYTAFENISRHALVSRATVHVGSVQGRLTMRIADNGAGLHGVMPRFEPNHGLTRAREYVRDLGGDLEIAENPRGGVVVEVWWPHEPT
jgi:signal transduction histidine kinase